MSHLSFLTFCRFNFGIKHFSQIDNSECQGQQKNLVPKSKIFLSMCYYSVVYPWTHSLPQEKHWTEIKGNHINDIRNSFLSKQSFTGKACN